jgi:hypothetical protein
MNTELCWFLLPLAGILSQIGGTWQKAFRRYGIPIAMATTWLLFKGFTPWLFLMVLIQFGAYCLPTTLKGDSIPKYAINWLWLPILGILQCSSVITLKPDIWVASVILGIVLGSFYALSNLKFSANYFQWKFVECFSGMLPATVLCLAITI